MQIISNFERFSGSSSRSLAAKVRSDGRIGLNATATKMIREQGIKWVELLWDAANCRIGLKAVESRKTGCYTVTFHSAVACSVTPMRFFNAIGWSCPDSVRADIRWDEGNRLFLIDLPKRFVTCPAANAGNGSSGELAA